MNRWIHVVSALTLLLGGCETTPDGGGAIPLEWTKVADGYDPGALLSIWAGSPDNVWVVGGEIHSPAVAHYDGTGWETHDPGVDQGLRWVHGFASGEVFVVGDGGAISMYADGTWTPMDSGMPGSTFWGVWGAAPDDIWAVGGPFILAADGVEIEKDAVVHYDGTSWSRVTLPDYTGIPGAGQLYKVWGSDADHVFIVGSEGRALHVVDGDLAWVDTEAGVPLWTVWGNSADNVYAVGGLFNNATLIHWDGSEWTYIDLADERPSMLQGLWVSPEGVAYVAGPDGYTASFAGGEWKVGGVITSLQYHAIYGDGGGALYVCGGDISTAKEDHVGVLSVTGANVPSLGE